MANKALYSSLFLISQVIPPMKFVAPLTEAERLTLLEARDPGPTAALRRRAQAVELSNRGYRLATIADCLNVHRETVSGWFDLWTTPGLRG